MKKKSRFCEWLEQMPSREMGKKLGVCFAAVGAWRRGDCYPNQPMAAKIIKMSKGELTWEDIYSVPLKKKNKSL